jgi:hypothetical protein
VKRASTRSQSAVQPGALCLQARRNLTKGAPRPWARRAALAWALVTCVGCIKAPDVVIVDRTTALEQQASGRFVALERELAQSGVSPRPQPYTRQQLDAAGWITPRERDAIAKLAEAGVRDRERLDGLLLRRCIGEAATGDLVQTRRACQGAVDTAAVSRLITRANRDRRQMWLYLRRTTRRSDADVRKAWRRVHLVELPCGAWMQTDDDKWLAKKC